jgi:hypothetical protein
VLASLGEGLTSRGGLGAVRERAGVMRSGAVWERAHVVNGAAHVGTVWQCTKANMD